MDKIDIKTYESQKERDVSYYLVEGLLNSPIPQDQLLANLGLFMKPKDLSRILFLDFIYRQIIDVQGIIIDFGTRWGNNIALFSSLRDIYEPHFRHRKIVGFDTFSGLPAISAQDGKAKWMIPGQLEVPEGYIRYLNGIMECHEKTTSLSHIKRYEIITGDASEQICYYLALHHETIIALAYFDFDLYKPTRDCLTAIKSRLVKGSLLAFDELNDPDSPGETLALQETFGLNNIRLKRYPYTSRVSYFVVE